MREFKRRWTTSDGTRKEFFLRWGRLSFRPVWRWLRGKSYHSDRPELSLRTLSHFQGECYCPDGSITDFRIALFGVGLWGHLSRSRVDHPCWCDAVLWTMFPENHEEDIECAGGHAALVAKFPDLADVFRATA